MRFASISATDLPARLSSTAAVTPVMPAPTTATSTAVPSASGGYSVCGVVAIQKEGPPWLISLANASP
jgi:hypothetical protein